MKIRNPLAALAAASTLALAPVAAACDTPDGRIDFSGGALAAGVGYSWGKGSLRYQGRIIPITVRGLSVLSVGGSAIEASGEVCNLDRLEDFDGNYTAAAAGATLAGGRGIATLQNQNGVVISLHTATQGLQLNLSVEGVAIKLATH